MVIGYLDHLVLTVADVENTIDFYTRVLGMRAETFGDDRKAVVFGHQKINLHQIGHEAKPNACSATPGSADLCFLTETPLAEVVDHLRKRSIPIEVGPIERTGATGPITSVYIRDPDGNLIELSNARDRA